MPKPPALALTLTLSTLLACTATVPPGETQETYEYEGCENEDSVCPRLRTVYCALGRIQAAHSEGCVRDDDCAKATVQSRCLGYGECPPVVVRTDRRGEFEAAAQAEVDRYCPESGGCRESGSCAYASDSFRPACRQGRCTVERVDGGSL